MDDPSEHQLKVNELWRTYYAGENPWFHRTRRIFHLLPSSPRCKSCASPFGGAGGLVMRAVGRRPSKMNPNLCSMCEDFARKNPGGAVIPLSLLFADIRDSSRLAETLGTAKFTALISRFYNTATDELIKADGLIDRLIGDEVIALFVPVLAGQKHADAALRAAQAILKATGHDKPDGPWVPLGVGVHTGNAFFGSLGSGGVSDITALGDDVNLTARLASTAAAGEILITESIRAASGLPTDDLEPRRLELKGRSAPVDVWSMRVAARSPDNKISVD